MTLEEIFELLSKTKPLPNDINSFLNDFTQGDVYSFLCAEFGYEVKTSEDLKTISEKLDSAYQKALENLSKENYIESAVLNTIKEDAFSKSFDEKIIREAIRLGFYPMSTEIKYASLLSVRYHNIKCIITFENFRIPKNTKKYIQDKFSNCTLTFNKAYDLVIENLLKAYPCNWLCPELLSAFNNIHNTPDNFISIDSVEIWRDGNLIAGELGFITGNTYASLTGFHNEDDSGTVQMAVLGLLLKELGFMYWDLGMSIPYKYRYGALEYNKKEQYDLWAKRNPNRIEFPQNIIPLNTFLEKDFPTECKEINKTQLMKFSEPGTEYACYGRQICRITEFLNLQILYSAYMQGVFPWFNEDEGEDVVWYSTNPRFILMSEDFHCPKSLKKTMKKSPYKYTMDKCFQRVMEECRNMKRDQKGTWIGKKMIETYTKFHKAGYAHSFEVWHNEKLAGGFYGVLIGSIFFGESMFTCESNSSKTAFAFFMEAFKECGGIIVDSQSYTDNIARYGGKNISRDAFLRIEQSALYTPLKKDLKEEFLSIANHSKK